MHVSIGGYAIKASVLCSDGNYKNIVDVEDTEERDFFETCLDHYDLVIKYEGERMKAHEIYQQIHDKKRVIADLQELINHIDCRPQAYHSDTVVLLHRIKDSEESELENLANQDFNQ